MQKQIETAQILGTRWLATCQRTNLCSDCALVSSFLTWVLLHAQAGMHHSAWICLIWLINSPNSQHILHIPACLICLGQCLGFFRRTFQDISNWSKLQRLWHCGPRTRWNPWRRSWRSWKMRIWSCDLQSPGAKMIQDDPRWVLNGDEWWWMGGENPEVMAARTLGHVWATSFSSLWLELVGLSQTCAEEEVDTDRGRTYEWLTSFDVLNHSMFLHCLKLKGNGSLASFYKCQIISTIGLQ